MPTEPASAPNAARGATNYGLLALAAVVALAVALWLFWPAPARKAVPSMTDAPVAQAPAAQTPVAASAPAPGAPHRIAVTLAKGAITGGQDTLQVRQGEQVELALSSDKPIMLHLHGYEVMAEAGPQQPGTLAFRADNAGRFPVHEHREGPGNHRAVFFVEVQP